MDAENLTEETLLVLRDALARRAPNAEATAADAALASSAVVVPVLFLQAKAHLLLTKRSMSVEKHKGQVCFPGGIREAGDTALVDTALREMEEELGVPKRAIDILGELDAVTTPTGFHITPFLGLMQQGFPFSPNREEIDRLLFVPLAALASMAETHKFPSQMPQFFFGGELIWGATGRIVAQVLRLILE